MLVVDVMAAGVGGGGGSGGGSEGALQLEVIRRQKSPNIMMQAETDLTKRAELLKHESESHSG